MSWLLALFPGRLWIYAAATAFIFALGGASAWKVQAWRITNINAKHTQAIAEATAKVAAAESAYQSKLIEAQNEKAKRQIVIQAAATGANSALYSLRGTASKYIAKDSTSACNVRTEAVTAVFDNCAEALVGLAATADRLENDRQLLLESWPR